MIIFYLKETGDIIGDIKGRIHKKEELNMWIGNKLETERIIIQWKPVRWFDKEGKQLKNSNGAFTADFEPEHEQKELLEEIENHKMKLYDYKIDLETKKLVVK